MNDCICGNKHENCLPYVTSSVKVCPKCGRIHNLTDNAIYPPTERSRVCVNLSPIVRCYFNKLQLQDAPYEIESDAPFIELNVDIAENVCAELLEKGIVDSYSIPDISNIPIIFI